MENRFGFDRTKHIAVLAVLLLVSGFSFAQQGRVRVIGAVPPRDTGNLYDVQVGAFRVASNADRAAEGIRRAGYTPCYESYGNLTRVIVRGLRFPELWPCIDRLGCAGFREVIVREKGPAGKTTEPQSRGTQSAQRPPDVPAAEPAESVNEVEASEAEPAGFDSEVLSDPDLPAGPDGTSEKAIRPPGQDIRSWKREQFYKTEQKHVIPSATGSVPSGL